MFDDEWPRDMVLPGNRFAGPTADGEKRRNQHLVMVYAHDAKGFWFDR